MPTVSEIIPTCIVKISSAMQLRSMRNTIGAENNIDDTVIGLLVLLDFDIFRRIIRRAKPREKVATLKTEYVTGVHVIFEE
jgi:hypothetical protein